MADVIDLLHINDITVMRTLDPEDDLADWKDTKLLARVLIDDELLDEGGACLPIVYEGQGARPVTRWELGGIQVPTDCIPLTLIITTTGHFEIFRFEIERGLDGIWHTEMVKSEKICLRFRAQVFLYHPLSCFHQEYHTTPEDDLIQWDIHPAEPWDERIGSLDRILGFPFLSAGQLVLLGVQHYTAASRSHGDNRRLEHALAAFERALQDPNLDPGLSQIVETVIPFLYCLIQGYTSCLDIALQVLQTFPDLQLGAEVPYAIVLDIVRRFEWHDYIPLAIKLVTGPLKHLLHSASPDTRFVEWVTLAYRLAPSAKEVLPLMDLMVDFHSGFPSSEGFALPMMRATIYFRRSIQPGRPSLGMTLGAAEFAMHSLAGREHSPHLGPTECQFIQWSFGWLLDVLSQDLAESKPYKDRLVSFVAWQLSHFPLSPRMQGSLRAIQSRLRGNIRVYAFERVKLSQPPILDDNDKQFIEECDQDLLWQKSGNEISVPTEYPRGAAELVRNLLMDADSGLGVAQLSCGIAATVAYALRLPEAFKVYSLFMGCLEESILSDRSLVGALRGPDVIHLVLRDAISCASETGNHASALQWSDQGCSQIWNWLFHSRLSIGQSFATEPVVARKLKTRPPWIGSWAKHQQDKLERYAFADGFDLSLKIPDYNRLPGLERFLRPKTPAEIISLAEVLGGPIVYLTSSRYSSHALAVLPGLDDVVHIPLPDLQDSILRSVSIEFTKSPYLREGFSMKAFGERKGFKVNSLGKQLTTSVEGLPAVFFLAYLWCAVVKPVLDGLGIQRVRKAAADMPRIWWCPSGRLIGLPIHAAGLYTDDGQGQGILDYVVSSYFPSASALAYATRPEHPSKEVSLLTIANPTGAGLPGTELELEKIEKHTLAATLPAQELTRGEASVEAVKKGMENTSWAHFACHGVANPDKPWESALILANHARLTLREISDMSLPHAEFAYLSACQTAKGVVEAPDQSAHLSTGMLVCGYRSVIGTMWKISDEYAPFVADRVYAKMLEGGRPDYKRAACALHDAVQALRKEPGVSFRTWLPFIHVGV